MTSAAGLAANKQNATKSTGPRTSAGKQRSSRNALRHGLSAAADFSESPQRLDTLARMLVSDDCDPELLAAARRLTSAEFKLVRIREERAKVLLSTYTGSELLNELRLLDRYLDRQRRQRTYALRCFDHIKLKRAVAGHRAEDGVAVSPAAALPYRAEGES